MRVLHAGAFLGLAPAPSARILHPSTPAWADASALRRPLCVRFAVGWCLQPLLLPAATTRCCPAPGPLQRLCAGQCLAQCGLQRQLQVRPVRADGVEDGGRGGGEGGESARGGGGLGERFSFLGFELPFPPPQTRHPPLPQGPDVPRPPHPHPASPLLFPLFPFLPTPSWATAPGLTPPSRHSA